MVEDLGDRATIESRAFVTASTSVETSDPDAFELADAGELLAHDDFNKVEHANKSMPQPT